MYRGLVALLPLLLLAPTAGAHPVGSPGFVNFLLDGFQTPDLAPSESGELRFTFTNTYPWTMSNVRLRLEVYRYVEIDLNRVVDASWPYTRPAFRDPFGIEHGIAYEPPIPDLPAGESVDVSMTVLTSTNMPHGTITKQGSYFVRTWLEFDLSDGVTTNSSVMASKGYFTDAQWDASRRPCLTEEEVDRGLRCPPEIYYEGLLNLTYLGSVYGMDHLDGLLPDTGFSVKERFPVWPFYAVGAVMVASLVFAVLFYAEENPGKYPRLARAWLSMKGRLRAVRPPRGPS